MSLIETDAVIVGAGPCGLFAVFELGMLNLRCHVIDALPAPGGQCAELYPEKPIYDIPALPACTGGQLIENLLHQIKPFGAQFHFNTLVKSLTSMDDGRWHLATEQGEEFTAPAIIIAAGSGSFTPKKIPLAGAERHENQSLFYAVREKASLAGQRLVITGGGDSALDWVLDLVDIADHLTLVHRRSEFRAAPDTVARVKALIDQGRITFKAGFISALESGDEGLRAVSISGPGDTTHRVECDSVLAFYGLAAQLGPLTSFGLEMRENQICVDTEHFQTSLPGVYAIGDVAWYPGKLKLILSGFHESALMAHSVKKRVHPNVKNLFQHSTTAMKSHLKARAE